MAAPAVLTQAQRANRLQPLTMNDFLACWFNLPAGVGLSGGLPPGGTPAQYRYIQRGDIAFHNLQTMNNFMRAYAQLELARVGLTRALGDFTNICQTALMQAWNASNQQQPAGGLWHFTNARGLCEIPMPAKWPRRRAKMINDIISNGWNTQPPAAMHQLPQWYIAELNSLGRPAPVLVAPNVLNAANVVPAALPAPPGPAGAGVPPGLPAAPAAGAPPLPASAGAPPVLPAVPAPVPPLLTVPTAATLAGPDPTTTTTTTVADNDRDDSDRDYEEDDDEGEEDSVNEDEGESAWETIDEEMEEV